MEVGGHGESGNMWMKVTDKKKQRRQEARDKKGQQSNGGVKGSTTLDSSQGVFAALDEADAEAAARRSAARDFMDATSSGTQGESSEEDGDAGVLPKGDLPGAERKPKPKKEKKPRVTVGESASKIDPLELASFLESLKATYAANPEIVLSYCADHFVRAFSAVTTASFQWQNILRDTPLAKAAQIPLCDVPEPVVTTMGDWLATQPAHELARFAAMLLHQILEDVPAVQPGGAKGPRPSMPQPSGGKTKVGLLIVLSILLRKKPDILMLEPLRAGTPHKGHDQLLNLAWAYAQAAVADPAVGVWVWSRHLLPLAVAKPASPAARDLALQFLESFVPVQEKRCKAVLTNQASRKGADRLVPPQALIELLRATYPEEAGRTKATSRFAAVFPWMKDIALAGGEKAAKAAALELLPLALDAASEEPPELSQEAAAIAVWCLSQTPDVYRIWESAHVSHMQGSACVLAHILHHWPHCGPSLAPHAELLRVVRSLRDKHHQLLESEAGPEVAAAQAAEGSCRALERKLGRSAMRCWTIAAIVVVGMGVAMSFLPIVDTVG